MTISFKVSDNVKSRMISFYNDKRRSKTPPYSLFQADDGDCIITLYSSGKVVFQGGSADIEAQLWKDLEMSLNNRNIDDEIRKDDKKKKDKLIEEKDLRFVNASTIGSDEVGTGDYFGPIVVTASFVSKDNINFVNNLGVRDSKKLSDDNILKIAPSLIKQIPHCTYIFDNESYNKYNTNMNKTKAVLHNKVLVEMVKRCNDFDYVVVDQFCYPKNYYEYIYEAKEKFTNITFTTKAEDKCLSVAVSSIISRYIFLKEMEKLENKYNIFLQKGASDEVVKQAVMIAKKYSFGELSKIAKLSFKTTDKVKGML